MLKFEWYISLILCWSNVYLDAFGKLLFQNNNIVLISHHNLDINKHLAVKSILLMYQPQFITMTLFKIVVVISG